MCVCARARETLPTVQSGFHRPSPNRGNGLVPGQDLLWPPAQELEVGAERKEIEILYRERRREEKYKEKRCGRWKYKDEIMR